MDPHMWALFHFLSQDSSLVFTIKNSSWEFQPNCVGSNASIMHCFQSMIGNAKGGTFNMPPRWCARGTLCLYPVRGHPRRVVKTRGTHFTAGITTQTNTSETNTFLQINKRLIVISPQVCGNPRR